ncbi:MAG: ribosomal L7Ae/L30e/S12e/Gadd45 family protein [Defluviitaleaceae bacterium]|nr:ribosomal L7Ae/L30e/S12e/Gadd45 family protein [Defluviitaleaceae bacterium]
MKLSKRAASLLSLASRAGKVSSGEESIEKALQSGTCQLIIISEEASGNTRKKFVNKCHYYGKEAIVCGTVECISTAIGRHTRVAVAVNDKGFAKLLRECIHAETGATMD